MKWVRAQWWAYYEGDDFMHGLAPKIRMRMLDLQRGASPWYGIPREDAGRLGFTLTTTGREETEINEDLSLYIENAIEARP